MAFESDNPTDTKPDLIALVEWPSTVEPDEYLAALYTDAYKNLRGRSLCEGGVV